MIFMVYLKTPDGKIPWKACSTREFAQAVVDDMLEHDMVLSDDHPVPTALPRVGIEEVALDDHQFR